MDDAFKKHIEEKLSDFLNKKKVFNWIAINGGCINNTYKISSNSNCFFIKTNTNSTFKNGFKEETLGLTFLKNNKALTPKIITEGHYKNTIYLILEWINSSKKTTEFWKNFGHQVAKIHQQKGKNFGLNYNNFIGSLPQINQPRYSCFATFFIENRLQPQLQLAYDQKLLRKKHLQQFERIFKTLKNSIPKEKPSAIHGDLWSGNFICNVDKNAVLFDPAVSYGHREADLAMTLLFGGFAPDFYKNYAEIYPLQKGFNNRVEIYNLYPLLIHLNLFGSHYLKAITNTISKF